MLRRMLSQAKTCMESVPMEVMSLKHSLEDQVVILATSYRAKKIQEALVLQVAWESILTQLKT
mgnify:CR=1 FL=1